MNSFKEQPKANSNLKGSVPGQTPNSQVTAVRNVSDALRLAQITSFSALIAAGTVLSTLFLGIPLPPPLTVVTIAPALYFAISVLYPRIVSFWSTAIGSAIGLGMLFALGFIPPVFAPIFIPGIVWARSPEALIIYNFRKKSTRWVAFGMALATIYETFAFFFSDWFFYSYGFLPRGSEAALSLALLDLGTLVDLVWIPVALVLVKAVRKAFNVQFFD